MPLQILSSVQFNPRLARCRADVMDNFRRLEPLIRQAGDLGTNFLVFPELCLTGYSFLSENEAGEVAEIQDGPTFLKMRTVAQSLRSFVSYGYVEFDDGNLYNSAVMIAPNGKVVTSYRKINLWGNDYLWATAGSEPASIVETEFGQTSLVICRDLRDKIPLINSSSSSKSSSLFDGQRIDLVAACTNWGKGGFPSTTWMDFSSDNNCTVVLSNRWGSESNGTFQQDFGQGGSAIIEKYGKVRIDGLVFNSDCVVSCAI